MRAMVNTGLKQAHELGGMYSVENPTKVIVMKYETQVVAGILHKLLLEVRLQTGSKLFKLVLWNQPWTGKNYELSDICVLESSSNFYSSQCDSALDCENLLSSKGICRELTK